MNADSSATAKRMGLTAIPGVFLQTEAGTDPDTFEYASRNFGLIDRTYPSDDDSNVRDSLWSRFTRYIQHLNENSSEETSYRLVYFGRHGEGDHNVAEAYYGTPEWDRKWSKLEGNGTVNWGDAHLTPVGQGQALAAAAFFAKQFTLDMPPAQRYYVSPLYRCLQTANFTFNALQLPANRPFRPLIKELLRETLGEHTCDRRSTRTEIHKAFPAWEIESGFTENDELWKAEHRETFDELDRRTRQLLEDVFDHDQSTVISLTSHSGAIASFLRVLGHREFELHTGALIPVLIRVDVTKS